MWTKIQSIWKLSFVHRWGRNSPSFEPLELKEGLHCKSTLVIMKAEVLFGPHWDCPRFEGCFACASCHMDSL